MNAAEARLTLTNYRDACERRAEQHLADWAALLAGVDTSPDAVTAEMRRNFAQANKQKAIACQRRAEALTYALTLIPQYEEEHA